MKKNMKKNNQKPQTKLFPFDFLNVTQHSAGQVVKESDQF